jgi:putative flippase GtrA
VTHADPSPASGASGGAGLADVWRSDDTLANRLVRVIRHPSSLKIAKYASVSVISTIVSQVTLLLTFGVFQVMSEVPANILANAVATVPSYYLNRSWVWGKNGKSHLWREVVPFWVLSFVGLAFSSLAVWLAGDVARHHHLHHFGTTVLVNGANLLSFAVLWVVKFLIYEKLFHEVPIELPPAEPDLVDA